jgi:hypothetical protein
MVDAMPSLAAVGLFAASLGWLLVRRTYLLVALLWLVIPMCWRLSSSLYIDLSGPIYSEQLMQHVGPGHSTALLVLDYITVLAVFALVVPRTFPGAAVEPPRWQQLNNLFFVLGVVLLVATYLDMLRIGPIPLLSGIERYDYARQYAGVLHVVFFRFGDVAALGLGATGWAIMTATYVPMLRLYRLHPVRALGLPFVALLYVAMTVDSAWQHQAGRGAAWKGRIGGGVTSVPSEPS